MHGRGIGMAGVLVLLLVLQGCWIYARGFETRWHDISDSPEVVARGIVGKEYVLTRAEGGPEVKLQRKNERPWSGEAQRLEAGTRFRVVRVIRESQLETHYDFVCVEIETGPMRGREVLVGQKLSDWNCVPYVP